MTTPLQKTDKIFGCLFLISLCLRVFLATTLDLGNDEAYYYTYSLHLDWSYFDHPPMVGWLIRLFTFNLLYTSAFYVRLGAIVLGSINLVLVYSIGKLLSDGRTGIIAALLYFSTLYGSVATGTFILPDSMLSFTWLFAIFIIIRWINSGRQSMSYLQWSLFGLVAGIALLSKYNGIFLWVAMVLYLIKYQWRELFRLRMWVGIFVTFLVFLPVIYWNINNQFISFFYQGDRIELLGKGPSFNYVFGEIFGEMGYINPLVFMLVFWFVFRMFIKKKVFDDRRIFFLLVSGLPIIFLLQFISIFRATLPHWACPGYLGLLFIPSLMLSPARLRVKRKRVRWLLSLSVVGFVLLISVGWAQITYGIIPSKWMKNNDPTVDLCCWKQSAEKFIKIDRQLIEKGEIEEGAPLLSWRWFPAANQEYYICRILKKEMLVFGALDNTHEYAWTQNKKKGLVQGMDAYFLAASHDFQTPEILPLKFEKTFCYDTLFIERNGHIIDSVFVYVLKNYQQ